MINLSLVFKLWVISGTVLLSLTTWGQPGPNPVGVAGAEAPLEDPNTTEYASITSYLAPFVFRGDGGRDPFRAPEIAIPLERGALYGPFLPLQKYRIEELTLKGLFWDIKNPKALVADPKGKVFRLGLKDYVGENFGYVASIREKELVIIQTLNESGNRYSTTKVMFFKKARSKP